MKSRWFHAPHFHTGTNGIEKKPSWLELFYDLVFVAAFIQLGNGLGNHPTVIGYLSFVAVFLALWVVWTGFSYYANRYTIDDFVHRIFVFLQMLCVGAMALFAPQVLNDHPAPFSLANGMAQLIIAALYLRSYWQVKEGRAYCRYWGLTFLVGGFMWTLGAFVPAPICYVLWAIGTLAVMISPFSKQSRILSDQHPIDQEHLSERFGILTIIVLGESFVKVLSGLSHHGTDVSYMLMGALVLVVTFSIWWIYFDDVAGSELKHEKLNPVIWLFAHLPLHAGITAVGVGIKKALDLEAGAPVPGKVAWLVAGSLALTFFAAAVIDYVTERRQAELSDRARVQMRMFSAIIVLVIAPIGATMSAAIFLTLIMTVCIAQVAFDMMMAPYEAMSEHEASSLKTIADNFREKVSPSRKRRDVREAVRMGTPSSLRRDFYFYLMEGSWTRLFLTFAFVYVTLNVIFAALYTIYPDSIAGGTARSFAEAFYFSVQTISTIGYGTLSPNSSYGNVLVTVQAAIGLLTTALATGVMFAKASRPKASVLFSKKALITDYDGVPTLMFRVGNARGNEIVDASMTVTAIVETMSKEGQHMRRLVSLPLTRSRSPFFILTWTAMHPIQGNSPLLEWLNESKSSNLVSVLATVIGHDSTYGQTIYERFAYYPEDIQHNRQFVDIISELDDGRLMVNYHRFHETKLAASSSR